MSGHPEIERPCAYIDRLGEVMDGDYCRMCERTVFDLDKLDGPGQRAFLTACAMEKEVCIRYRVPTPWGQPDFMPNFRTGKMLRRPMDKGPPET